MALSLADELAGAFDSSSGGAVGQSLADEFGLDEFTENGQQNGYHEDTLSPPRSPLRAIDHNRSPSYPRPSKTSTESNSTYGHTSVLLVDEELDVALHGPVGYGGSHAHQEDGVVESSSSVFLGPKMDKDPIVILQSVLASTSQFRSLLVDVPKGDAHERRSEPVGDISDRLQRHLDHIQESDRIREDQCREMMVLLRDGGAVNWEGIDIVEVIEDSSSSTRHTVTAQDEDIGWTGELHNRIEEDWVDVDRDPPAGPETHEQAHDLDGMMEESEHPAQHSLEPQLTLPRHTADLIKSSSDLVSTLSSLADTVHSTSSLATATSRQLRGIKAGIDSWRDRETQEDAARVGVDAWERTRLTAGLGGISTRAALDKELEGFKRTLEDAAAEVDALQQRYGQHRRWTDVLAG